MFIEKRDFVLFPETAKTGRYALIIFFQCDFKIKYRG